MTNRIASHFLPHNRVSNSNAEICANLRVWNLEGQELTIVLMERRIIFTLRPNLRGKVAPTDVEMVETTTEPKGCDFQQDVDYTFVGGAWY